MLPHQKLPVIPSTIFSALGNQCIVYEQAVFDTMKKLTKEYAGGLYEYRRHTNGAFLIVLDDESIVSATWGHEEAKITMEAVCIAANMIVSEGVCNAAYNHGDEDTALFFRNLLDTQRDALYGRLNAVIDWNADGYFRSPTEEEAASAIDCKAAPFADDLSRLLS